MFSSGASLIYLPYINSIGSPLCGSIYGKYNIVKIVIHDMSKVITHSGSASLIVWEGVLE